MNKLIFSLLFILSGFCLNAQSIESLRTEINQILSSKNLTAGISLKNLENKDTLSINGNQMMPMMSVFKFHIALAVLHEVDQNKLQLNQQFFIKKEDLYDKVKEVFSNRFKNYNQIFNSKPYNFIIPVAQTIVKSEQEMKTLAAEFVSKGYEGLMLKPGNGEYDFGKRSVNLLKYKEMHSDEFKIKDIFIAENDPERVQIELYIDPFKSQETFKIGTLKGNKEDNYKNYYLNKSSLIGSIL